MLELAKHKQLPLFGSSFLAVLLTALLINPRTIVKRRIILKLVFQKDNDLVDGT
jgi:hypothetical protein